MIFGLGNVLECPYSNVFQLPTNLALLFLSKAKLSNIIVAIGPCISQKSYEVKKDFVNTIKKKNSDFKKYFNNNNNKIYFDLRMFVYNKFLKLGIPKKNIENINQDTYSNSKNFFSYRRSVHNNDADYGRCISVICRN